MGKQLRAFTLGSFGVVLLSILFYFRAGFMFAAMVEPESTLASALGVGILSGILMATAFIGVAVVLETLIGLLVKRFKYSPYQDRFFLGIGIWLLCFVGIQIYTQGSFTGTETEYSFYVFIILISASYTFAKWIIFRNCRTASALG